VSNQSNQSRGQNVSNQSREGSDQSHQINRNNQERDHIYHINQGRKQINQINHINQGRGSNQSTRQILYPPNALIPSVSLCSLFSVPQVTDQSLVQKRNQCHERAGGDWIVQCRKHEMPIERPGTQWHWWHCQPHLWFKRRCQRIVDQCPCQRRNSGMSHAYFNSLIY
jgi:hypothetical protein